MKGRQQTGTLRGMFVEGWVRELQMFAVKEPIANTVFFEARRQFRNGMYHFQSKNYP